ncbi:MAG: efflux RND transporter periplasmic adaptor subunit [Thermodesulfobacteriota bacterium]
MNKAMPCIVLIVVLSFPLSSLAKEKVGALGRIQPSGGVIQLVGPPGDRISEIVVKEGESVKSGATLVVFEGKVTHELELAQAELALREAEEVGAKSIALQALKLKETDQLGRNAIVTQEKKIAVAGAEHDFARKRLNRYEGIEGERLSAQQMDERKSQVEVTQAKLAAAKLEMERLRLSHEIGVALARLELDRLTLNREISMGQAGNRLSQARERLKQSVLRAPRDGTILEIFARPGESSGGRPVLTMADLESMYVIAEIFEGDLLKITPGMTATITGSGIPGPLKGAVESVGRVITGSSRTANVKVRLSDSKAASRLINMEVDISIDF